ncbi:MULTISPECIES: AraC family transcriptional regulator [unclassified Dysgonomonas]|uniref:AraC family transcriptional regulator n=1 Tax=unclassified Dysgonomonas TaxID=2630389 RepID=UPI0013EC695F|nr:MULTISPECIES: AraC family transcriptional regulator [unclassified Dysgonomonas]
MKPLYQDLPFTPASYVNVYKEELPHFIVPWHYHPEIEIMYILEGTGTRFVGDHIEEYGEGDLCIIGANLPHEWRNDDIFFHKESNLRASCLCLFFQRELFGANLLNLPEMDNIKSLLEKAERGVKFVGKSREEIGKLINEYVNENGAGRIAKLILLLEQMASAEEYESLASVGYTRNTLNSGDFERFNKVYQYILRNFTRPIRLEEVSSLVGLTPNAFCRYFRDRTKKTFVQYLNDVRIGHAKKLLIEDKMTISALSIESGFYNLSNFIDQFKRSTNMSPSEYQRKYGAKNRKVPV